MLTGRYPINDFMAKFKNMTLVLSDAGGSFDLPLNISEAHSKFELAASSRLILARMAAGKSMTSAMRPRSIWEPSRLLVEATFLSRLNETSTGLWPFPISRVKIRFRFSIQGRAASLCKPKND